MGLVCRALHHPGCDRLDDRDDGARETAHQLGHRSADRPFVLTAWLLLFSIYPFGQLHPTKLIGPMPVHPGAAIQTDLQGVGGGAVGLTAASDVF